MASKPARFGTQDGVPDIGRWANLKIRLYLLHALMCNNYGQLLVYLCVLDLLGSATLAPLPKI